jgi:hypothetical protein
MYCIVLVMTQTMTKPSTATRAQVDSKALFARLLAAESIVVEHRRDAHTAWFETDTRRLVLPVWQDMSNETYNMLVAHEVSHALYSPKGTSWLDDLTRIDPDNAAVVKGFFNIVEDARIERLIKVRYPGLRSDFLSAYRSLFDQDKFGIKGQDVATMSLIDRINLHYKVGVFVNVPFSAEELPLVRECAETKTYADALDLTRRIYEFAKTGRRKPPATATIPLTRPRRPPKAKARRRPPRPLLRVAASRVARPSRSRRASPRRAGRPKTLLGRATRGLERAARSSPTLP